jgi:predicted RNase H-like HicB family nuclease
MKTLEIRAIALQEDGWWVAQCLEYDIATQARTLADLERDLQQMIETHILLGRERGRPPFESIGKAPDRFWKMWDKAEFRLEKAVPARPKAESGDLPVIRPNIRIAERLAA